MHKMITSFMVRYRNSCGEKNMLCLVNFFVYRHKAFFGQSYTKTTAMKVERDTIAASVASPIIYVVTK